MARVVPDVLPKRATISERNVLEILEGLPDDVLIYYEVTVSNRHPDIIIIDPAVGIIVLEVKGWRAGDIKSANREECQVQFYGHNKTVLHPLKQAREYTFRLMDEMKLNPHTRQFWPDGKCSLPYVWLGVLSSTTRKLLHKNFGSATDEVFPSDRILTKDDLGEMKLLPPAKLRDFFRQRFDPWWQFDSLQQNRIDSIRAWLHPEIVLSIEGFTSSGTRVQETFSDWDNIAPPALKVLDLQQESHATRIGAGHRLLLGVAGSGKTCILIARAKLMHDYVKDIRILFLCYNKLLAEYLRSVMGKRNIEIRNFHKWGTELGVSWFQGMEDSAWNAAVLRKVRTLPVEDRYDLILVDEVQDFESDWLLASRLALKDPEEGDFLLAGDGCQSLYRNKKFKWSSIGIKAAGRVIGERYNLNRNYRNSREIVTLAQNVMTGALNGSGESETDLPSMVGDPSISPRETQIKPILWKCESRESECSGAAGLVTMLVKGEWPETSVSSPLKPEEIAILYPKKISSDLIQKLINTLEAERIACSWLSQPKGPTSYGSSNTNQSGVKIQTIHSSKGLQYRAVILIWADALSTSMGLDEQSEAQLLYVACTRAEDYLGILYSNPTCLLDSLKNSGSALHLHS